MFVRRLIGAAPLLALTFAGIALLIPLAAYAILGWFARYTADDYCTAAAERVAGYLGAQLNWYQGWSGRFTYYALVGLIELAGPAVVQVLPAIALALWTAAGAWALHTIAKAESLPAPSLVAAVVSAAVVFVCVSGAPNLDQSLYWQTGMLTYLLPLILLTAFFGWLARWLWSSRPRRRTHRDLLLVGVFLFLSAGISETTLSLQLALIALATSLSVVGVRVLRIQRLQATPALLATGLLATGLAAAIVIAAPGNAIHQISLTGSTHPLSELPQAVQASVDFVGLFARWIQFRARPGVLILVAVSGYFGWQRAAAIRPGRTGRVVVWHIVGLCILLASEWILLIAATTPAYFAQGWDPPERAQLVSVWVVAVGMALAAYIVGQALRVAARRVTCIEHARRPAVVLLWPAVVLLLTAAPIRDTRTILARIAADAAYAAQWDATDATIRSMAAAGQPVVLESELSSHFGFDFIGPDPTVYPNPCVAQFYGVPSIVAVTDNG